MLGVENYINSRDSRDMMSMPGPYHMPMGALPPNYPMPRPDQMYQGMVPSWPGQGYPAGPGGYGDAQGDMGHHGQTETGGMPPNKYDPPPVSPPPQRERFSYTRYQIELLNGIYEGIRYPNSMQKQLMAKRVGITRDQVKIWFQNRRRKDVVGKYNPAKAAPVEDPGKPRMVPLQVMKGVLSELSKFENDPKGKKIKEALAKSERSIQAHKRQKTGSDSPESDVTKVSPNASYDDLVPSPKYQPQGNFALVDTYGMSQAMFPNPALTAASEPGASPRSHIESFSSSSCSAESPESSLHSPQEVEATTQGPPAPAAIPSLEQLDMVAPPNRIIPHQMGNPNPLKRAHSEESLSDLSASFENITPPPVKTERDVSPPPNRVAPPSQPIKFSINSAFVPTKPLSVHIPTSVQKSPPANPQAEQTDGSLAAMANMPMQWHMPDYSQYAREQQAYGNHSDDQSSASAPAMQQYGNTMPTSSSEGKSLNINGVFPFPLVAEPPRMMTSMASYPEHYAHAQTMTAGGYQPLMISSFNNPYYGYDTSGWPGYQDKQPMTKN